MSTFSRAPGQSGFRRLFLTFVTALVAWPLVDPLFLRSEQSSRLCPNGCSVSLRRIAALNSGTQIDLLPIESIYVVDDGVGRFLLASRGGRKLLAFSRTGGLEQVVPGGGATSFRMITNILPEKDGRVNVYDTIARSLFRFDKGLKGIDARPMRYRPAFMLEGGAYVHAEQIATRDRIGLPLHLISADGAVVRSFGAERAEYREDEPFRFDRLVTPSADGTIWSIAPGRYVAERWDPVTGARKQVVAVQSPWFRESDRAPRSDQRPTPIAVGLWEERGVLWVLFRDADVSWRPRLGGERPWAQGELDNTYDSVLEAVSIANGRVVASTRSDTLFYAQGPSPLLARWIPAGRQRAPQIEILKAQLVTKEKNR